MSEHAHTPTPEQMVERLIQAAVDYEIATGIYVGSARQELNEARAEVESAIRKGLPAIAKAEGRS